MKQVEKALAKIWPLAALALLMTIMAGCAGLGDFVSDPDTQQAISDAINTVNVPQTIEAARSGDWAGVATSLVTALGIFLAGAAGGIFGKKRLDARKAVK